MIAARDRLAFGGHELRSGRLPVILRIRMIHLSYRLSGEFNEKAPIIDWATADEMTLRYYVFTMSSAVTKSSWSILPTLVLDGDGSRSSISQQV